MNPKRLFVAGVISFAGLALMTALLLLGAFNTVDSTVAGMVDMIRNSQVRTIFKKITVMGDWRGISFVAVIAAIGLIAKSRLVEALSLAVAIPLTSVAYSSMKILTGRARPTLTDQITSLSFPSGHAAMSAVFYFSLLVFTSKYMKKGYLKTALMGFLIMVPVLVGLSRIYLGRHWMTDVLAGWLLGIGVACFVMALFRTRDAA